MAKILKMSQKQKKESEKRLQKIEKQVEKVYKEYEDDMSEKFLAYFDRLDKKMESASLAIEVAMKSGDKTAIAEAQKKYKELLQKETLGRQEYKSMLDNTAFKMANVNQIALDIVNDSLPSVYAFSYNQFGAELDSAIKGYSFTLVDESTVKKLAQDPKKLRLPYKELDKEKDKKWNIKAINSQLMQGIMQGEPVRDIAKRFQNVAKMDELSSIRNARTMYTSCENAGRQDSMEKASEDGVIMHKVWLSALDKYTRTSHEVMNGTEVEVDEPFILYDRKGDPHEMMYPAEPIDCPELVYNCRCTMYTKVIGFKKKED